MAPAIHSFPAAELPLAVQVDVDGKRRRTEDMRRPVDLVQDCELSTLFQYECYIDHPEMRDSRVRCWPVQRFFRQCQDKKGKFTVETTAWEGPAAAAAAAAAASSVTPTKN
ncbi:hypothetical protein QBC37DRAFT_420922 [Rhypophila decipiens]|uniref:Uncharacterized protein n=1 Tax=Rhypophila decipiens TaxID=261697 RepID=A0AAN6Y9L5_9PEZI|nr:hypothetical protein QBC37DRAFT_420922 [Rhypophila decipiens]